MLVVAHCIQFSSSHHLLDSPLRSITHYHTLLYVPYQLSLFMPVLCSTVAHLPARQRSSSRPSLQASIEGSSFKKCSDLWFHDGNIIILAGGFGFCVHRGQLQRHSETFADMLELPFTDDRVLLHDKPSDVYHFLKALYDGAYVAYQLLLVRSYNVSQARS